MVAEADHFSKGPNRRYVNHRHLHMLELLYSFMAVLSFYLLFLSRSEEVHTVWEVMHPAFIPVFFATTVLLLAIIFSSEQAEHKLLLIIIHSILSHVFFVVIFPAGYFGAQQATLGKTRLVYDNVIFDGIPLGPETILVQAFNWFRGINFQAALSVVLARMFGIDFFWGHLFFVPLMWGTFVPVTAFLVTRAFCEDKNVSVLSSLLVSLFPTSIIWGTYSVKNSLGFIFFFCSLYFILKYLFTSGPKASFLMMISSFATVVSHPLTGIVIVSLVLLAIILKNYENEKAKNPLSAKISLLLSFLISTSLLPLALVSFRLVSTFNTNFSLDKLYELSPTQIVGELILGQCIDFSLGGALICSLAPLVGFIGMIYLLRSGVNAGPDKTRRVSTLFLFMGFLMVLVDYRILRLFMVNLPFREVDRLWVFRDFMATPFVAFVVSGIVASLQRITSKLGRIRAQFLFSKLSSASRAILIFAIAILLSGWITASVHFAYPHQGPLQTTSYELEAVKYIETNANESYVVISDLWMMYAGGMIVGVHNPRAYYFSTSEPEGVALFNEMKMNVSIDTMVEAMEYNNATSAYFIIEEPRLGEEEYNRIIQQAQLNGLQTYKTFLYRGEEKLRIFHHKEFPE